eukprot:Em0006g1326a
MQRGIKWWLGLPLTPELGVCAYCPDKALDAHHAVTCKFGGDVVERHNAMRNAIFDFCKRALLNPKLEAGAGLGHERRLTRPADILIPSWSNGDKPAAIDVSITSPLISNILSEAGVVAGAAARQTEERKHTCNDTICSELGWKCVPLVVETFGAWGGTAGQFFGELASRLAAQSHSSKTTMLNNIYGRLSLILVRANARAFNARWQLAVTEECTHAFLELKKQLVSAPVLVMPQFTQEFILDADASGEGLGAILSQVIEGQERVVAYANHSVLQWLHSFKKPEGHIARWLEQLAEYNYTDQEENTQMLIVSLACHANLKALWLQRDQLMPKEGVCINSGTMYLEVDYTGDSSFCCQHHWYLECCQDYTTLLLEAT